MEMTRAQINNFQNALLDAFRSRDALKQMIFFGMGENLDNLVGNGGLRSIAFEVIQWSQEQGRDAELLKAAVDANKGNPRLKAFAAEMGPGAFQAVVALDERAEAFVRDQVGLNGFLDVNWLQKAISACRPVCRVETPAQFGTGFLLDANIVITNYHVMKEVIADPTKAAAVELRFDFARKADGSVDKGTVHKLANDWLITSSPYSATDPAQLDYALLRVADRAGEDVLGNQTRAWLTPQVHTFHAGEDLFIVQHPSLGSQETEPLKMVLATKAVTGTWDNGARVLYLTNTQHGSSGSPCFTNNWELVALHHSSYIDPQHPNDPPKQNEGIPFSVILQQPEVRAALQLP